LKEGKEPVNALNALMGTFPEFLKEWSTKGRGIIKKGLLIQGREEFGKPILLRRRNPGKKRPIN